MKKSLIALAVMAAAGAASAQSSVTLYGTVDAILHKDKGASTALTSGGVGSSNFGLKGSEDLGGGLKANFKLEQGFGVDTGSATAGQAFSRESWVGVSGGFGEVQVGKTWSAYDDVYGGFGVFDANVLAPAKLVFPGYRDQAVNGIKYMTPTYAGFSGAVSLSLKEDSAVTGLDENVASYNVKYENGPFAAAVAYQDNQGSLAADKLTFVNASYNFGVVKLLGAFQQSKDVAGDKTNGYNLAVDYPVASNLVLSAAYGSSKADGAERQSVTSLAAAYLLSKRTTVYAGIANGNDEAAAAGAPDSRVGFGVRHSF
jgi:predicted porin